MQDVRHAAVWIAAVLVFVLGAAWYTVFADPWLSGIGKTRDQLLVQGGGGPGMGYAVGFGAIVVLCYALAWLLERTATTSAAGGARTGIVAALGFCSATIALNYAFEVRPLSLWLINAGYVTLGLALAGAVMAGWRRKATASAREASA